MVRNAGPADIPAMRQMERCCATASHWGDSEYARIFAPGERPRLALVLEEGGKVLGFIVAAAAGADWEIENVVVAEEHRRRGLGGELLAEFLRRARQQGTQSAFLEVRESNHAARKLYERWGFVEAGRRRAYYPDPPEDAMIYRKDAS